MESWDVLLIGRHCLGHSLDPALGTPGKGRLVVSRIDKAGRTLFEHHGLQASGPVLLLVYVSHLLGQTRGKALSTCILTRKTGDTRCQCA